VAIAHEHITDVDLRALPRDGRKYEWVGGTVRVSPAGYRHGRIVVRLLSRLEAFVSQRGLGHVLDSSTGYRLPTGNVRSPDASFVSSARVPVTGEPTGFAEFAPDLAVEVLSPDDRPRDVLDKVGEYLGAGVKLVWVIDPERRSAVAFRSLTDTRSIDAAGLLDGEDVVAGFACPLAELLP
jgi:Uma2 family endonuclease